MFEAAEIGATGMRAHQTQIDTIAHNVANLNTAGFRRSSVSFAEVSAALTNGLSADVIDAVRAGLQARGAGTLAQVNISALGGEIQQTGGPLDVAIDGEGFLEVVRSDGSVAYTRAGALKINSDGLLATTDGSALSNRIAVPPDARNVRIAADGRVHAQLEGKDGEVELGQIDLVTFPNLAGLKAVGDNQYVAQAEAGAARVAAPAQEGMGSLRQGFLESSNVRLVDELVAMMLAQRAFEMNSKVVQAADQLMAITNGLVR